MIQTPDDQRNHDDRDDADENATRGRAHAFFPAHQGAVDRQPPQGDAGRGIDRVAQRGRPAVHAGLADAAGRLAALDDMNLDLRRLVDAQHAVVMEVGLLDASLVDGDLAVERGGQAEDQPAFELRHDRVGIDGDAGIDRRGDAAQLHFALFVDFGFHHGRDEAAERRLHADAAPDARRQRLAPVGFFRHEIERRQQPRLLAEHGAAEVDRILARLARQFVHEAFDGEHVVVGTDAAPESGRHRRRFGPHIFDMEIGNVVGHVDGAIDGVDVDALLERRRQPARDDRRAGDACISSRRSCRRTGSRQWCRDRPGDRCRAGCLLRGSTPP